MVADAYKTYTREQNRKHLNSNYLFQYRSDYHHTYFILQFVIIIIFLHQL